jgi:hypothetical protein
VEGGDVLGVITRTAGILVSGFFSVGFVALSLITLLPAVSSKPNLMGYYGVCSFAPASTCILIVFALVSLIVTIRIRNRSLRLPQSGSQNVKNKFTSKSGVIFPLQLKKRVSAIFTCAKDLRA